MLRVRDLTGKDIERSRQNHETYKLLYEKCAACIKQRNDLGHIWLRHTVPGYVIGRPLFSIDHAKRYIREKLIRGKFRVEEFEGDLIICWGDEKERAIRKMAGIKAPKKTKSSRKKDRGVGEVDHRKSSSDKKRVEEPLSVRLARLNFNLNKR